MISHLFFYQLVLIALVWLCVMLQWVWPSAPAAACSTTPEPPPPRRKRSREPKPFVGLTTKPHCDACAHASDLRPAAPCPPPPRIVSTRGRRRQVDTSTHFCPNPDCAYRGWVGWGNLRANGHPNGGPWRQLLCVVCRGYFLETLGTLFHGKRAAVDLIVRVIACLAEGLGIRGTARVFEVDPNTVLQWLVEAADQLQAFSRHVLHDVRVQQVQMDELFALLSAVKDGKVSAAEAIERLERSPQWVWVAMDPESKLLLALDVGERTLAMAQRVVHHITQVLAPDCVPLFLTDGLREYMTALLTHYGHWVQPERRQAQGPAPKPRWMPLPQLLYAQVVKTVPYGQKIRTRLPMGGYASTIARSLACLPLPSHPYSSSRGTPKPEGEMMDWKHLLAYITGTVDQELLLRNEYLVTENRMLRNQITGRVRLTDAERKTLAEIGQKLGKQALTEVAHIVKPDTILAWHRKLVAQKFDGSQQRKGLGRPPINTEVEALVMRLAQENRSWGYDRIVGALANLGYMVSDQTVGNILKRHGIPPAPERKTTTTWKEFIRTHMDVLVATDFFTAEVWTLGGLVTYYVLFFIHLGTRQVHVAGVTPHPTQAWMMQVARNITMEEWGFLSPGQYLIHDRDGKYCPAFQQLIDAAGVTRVPLPPRSPNLNAYAERWVGSIKEECLSRLILFGEASLHQALTQYVEHFHHERNHQGKGNVVLFPTVHPDAERAGPIQCRERLGGLLKFYDREAA